VVDSFLHRTNGLLAFLSLSPTNLSAERQGKTAIPAAANLRATAKLASRFGAFYRSVFGKPPSTTLWRVPDHAIVMVPLPEVHRPQNDP
jgi:hypothetical protein